MSEQQGLDISKVIGLIMENPQLIEQISSMAKGYGESTRPAPPEEPQAIAAPIEKAEPTNAPTYSSRDKSNRAQLLGALKPFVSPERAKAIDSMITIADILDVMRTR